MFYRIVLLICLGLLFSSNAFALSAKEYTFNTKMKTAMVKRLGELKPYVDYFSNEIEQVLDDPVVLAALGGIQINNSVLLDTIDIQGVTGVLTLTLHDSSNLLMGGMHSKEIVLTPTLVGEAVTWSCETTLPNFTARYRTESFLEPLDIPLLDGCSIV
jgi:hypothetical protein